MEEGSPQGKAAEWGTYGEREEDKRRARGGGEELGMDRVYKGKRLQESVDD